MFFIFDIIEKELKNKENLGQFSRPIFTSILVIWYFFQIIYIYIYSEESDFFHRSKIYNFGKLSC